MAVGDRRDPYLALNFELRIEGLTVGAFSEVTGLRVEIEVKDYREGGVNEYVHKLAGPARYPSNLVLKRGLVDSDALWCWHQDVTQGIIERKNGSIVLLDSARAEQWHWDFIDAYPVRWVGPQLRAGTAEVAVETLELVHRGLVKVKP